MRGKWNLDCRALVCHPCLLWHDCVLQVYWPVTEQRRSDCINRGKLSEVCTSLKKCGHGTCLRVCGWNKGLTSMLDMIADEMPKPHSNPTQIEWHYNVRVWDTCLPAYLWLHGECESASAKGVSELYNWLTSSTLLLQQHKFWAKILWIYPEIQS